MSTASSRTQVSYVSVLVLCACALGHAATHADEAADLVLIAQVNQAVNHRIAFMSDAMNWGEVDHWTTPEELFRRGAGDCEDLAIAKFFALLEAGVPPERVRMVYTQVLLGGTGEVWRGHMVVAYLSSRTAAGDERILDNLIDAIHPLSHRPDLRVKISFDTVGVWNQLDRGPPVRDAQRIVPWAGVLQRMSKTH